VLHEGFLLTTFLGSTKALWYFIIVVQFISSLFDFHLSFVCLLFDFCFSFDSFAFHCSLFVVQRKRFNSDPGLYSRYFDPVVREVPVHHNLCKAKKYHT
jgi:hypothetical protein